MNTQIAAKNLRQLLNEAETVQPQFRYGLFAAAKVIVDAGSGAARRCPRSSLECSWGMSYAELLEKVPSAGE